MTYLTTFFPLSWSSNLSDYNHFEGPDKIIYSAQGANPFYYKNNFIEREEFIMKDFKDVNVITLDFKELAEKFSQDDWLVNGLFKKGTFNIITGSYEEETNVAYKLATCLNNGIDFFGHNVKKSSCLYVDCMHSNSEIFHKL